MIPKSPGGERLRRVIRSFLAVMRLLIHIGWVVPSRRRKRRRLMVRLMVTFLLLLGKLLRKLQLILSLNFVLIKMRPDFPVILRTLLAIRALLRVIRLVRV